MTVREVLEAMAKDGHLAEQVLSLLDAGMWDEWDCGLAQAGDVGFGPAEFAIAARSGAATAAYYETQGVQL